MNQITKMILLGLPPVAAALPAALRRAARNNETGGNARKYSQVALWVALTVVITMAAATPALACGDPGC